MIKLNLVGRLFVLTVMTLLGVFIVDVFSFKIHGPSEAELVYQVICGALAGAFCYWLFVDTGQARKRGEHVHQDHP